MPKDMTPAERRRLGLPPLTPKQAQRSADEPLYGYEEKRRERTEYQTDWDLLCKEAIRINTASLRALYASGADRRDISLFVSVESEDEANRYVSQLHAEQQGTIAFVFMEYTWTRNWFYSVYSERLRGRTYR